MDSKPRLGDGDQEPFIKKFIKKLKSIPEFRDALIVFIPETNMLDGTAAAKLLRRMFPEEHVIISSRSVERRFKVGVIKDNNNTYEMARFFRSALISETVYFYEGLFTTNPNKTASQMRKTILEQMDNYEETVTVSKDGKRTRKLSGKGAGPHGGKDDLLITIQMLYFYHFQFLSSRTYANKRREHGITS